MKAIRFLFFGFVLALISVPYNLKAAEGKPVFLYSQYFTAPGDNRYLPDGTFKEALELLSKEFEVRANDKPLTAENLKGVNVVLVANPGDKALNHNPPPHHIDARDIREITRFVQNGGGFIVMANQENHNFEINDMNKLLARWGIQYTNLYTDAKKLVLPKETPMIGGLRWAYYTGNLLRLDPSNSAKPAALVNNDLQQRPQKGERDQSGVLMAIATPGKGHVLVSTDTGWVCDWAFQDVGVGGVALKGEDNKEIFRRLALWAAGNKVK